MNYSTYLNIETNIGIIAIPFLGLKQLDYFTIGFRNDDELVRYLVKKLDLTIKEEDILKIYITDSRYNKQKFTTYKIIKYGNDFYQFDSLVDEYSRYLYADRRRITNANIKSLMNKISYNLNDVKKYVREFFKDYINQREAYFHLKSRRYCDILTKKIIYFNNQSNDKQEINSESNTYINALIRMNNNGEIDSGDFLDELAKMDFEDIECNMDTPEKSLFDGLTRNDCIFDEDGYILELAIGMTLEELENQLSDFRNRSFLKRTR